MRVASSVDLASSHCTVYESPGMYTGKVPDDSSPGRQCMCTDETNSFDDDSTAARVHTTDNAVNDVRAGVRFMDDERCSRCQTT